MQLVKGLVPQVSYNVAVVYPSPTVWLCPKSTTLVTCCYHDYSYIIAEPFDCDG